MQNKYKLDGKLDIHKYDSRWKNQTHYIKEISPDIVQNKDTILIFNDTIMIKLMLAYNIKQIPILRTDMIITIRTKNNLGSLHHQKVVIISHMMTLSSKGKTNKYSSN